MDDILMSDPQPPEDGPEVSPDEYPDEYEPQGDEDAGVDDDDPALDEEI
jgi:hypothetical protein